MKVAQLGGVAGMLAAESAKAGEQNRAKAMAKGSELFMNAMLRR